MILVVGIIGLCIGSFISLLTSRIIKGGGFVFTRSHCPNCLHKLGVFELIPVFSWVFLLGKCKSCKSKISIRYPIIELLTASVFMLVYYMHGYTISPKSITVVLIAATLISICIIDIEEYFIPDMLQYLLAIFVAILYLIQKPIPWMDGGFISAGLYLIFGLVLFGSFYLITKKEAIGIDDLKILFTLGFILGLNKFAVFIFLSGIFGVVFGYIWKKFLKMDVFPFAPALCLSAFLCILFPMNLNLFSI